MTLTLTAAGTAPVSLAEAKKQVRVEYHSDDDAIIAALLAAATDWVQKHTGRSLSKCEWTLTLDEFPDAINLPMPPAVAVTSVRYIDALGEAQTLSPSAYRLYGAGGFAPFVRSAWSTCWPATAEGEPDAVTVVYDAGAETVPAPVKQAILLLVGHLFENREASTEAALKAIPFGVDALLKDYRQQAF